MNSFTRKLLLPAVLVLFATLPILSLAGQDADFPVRRFGLFIGANDGGNERITLRYALSDAQRVAEVLSRVGGVGRTDMVLLDDPSPEEIRSSAEKLMYDVARAKTDSRRVEFVLYYSGHSDEHGLLLDDNQFSYQELRDLIHEVDADVSVAILDSCSSGSFTRLKGGFRAQPFLMNDSAEMSGHAFLTSSSDNEASQESDEIGASFFTHYFVSGLLGAADSTNDRRVTLNEVYQYAFTETLSRTTGTYAGPQHPSYDIQLTGAGDLVLTDLSQRTASIILGPDIAGRVYLRDHTGTLIAELEKFPQSPVQLAVEPGSYLVELVSGTQRRLAEIRIAGFSEALLGESDFAGSELEQNRVRGDGDGVTETDDTLDDVLADVRRLALEAIDEVQKATAEAFSTTNTNRKRPDLTGETLTYVPVTVDVFPGMRIYPDEPVGSPSGILTNFAVGLPISYTGPINGAAMSYFLNFGEGPVHGVQYAAIGNMQQGGISGVQMSGVFNITDGDVRGVQSAGVINILDDRLRGVQSAGAVNISVAPLTGLQASGAVNIAGDFVGMQVSTVNVAENGRGVQAGVVNIADSVSGMQLGLVNIADDVDGITLGLVNIIRFGVFDFSLSMDDAGVTWSTFQHGTRGLYTVYQFGVLQNDLEGMDPEYFGALGFGSRVWGGTIYLDVELLARMAYSENYTTTNTAIDYTTIFPSLRLSGGIQLGRNLAVFAGVSFDGRANWLDVPESALYSGDGTFEVAGEGVTVFPHTFIGIKM